LDIETAAEICLALPMSNSYACLLHCINPSKKFVLNLCKMPLLVAKCWCSCFSSHWLGTLFNLNFLITHFSLILYSWARQHLEREFGLLNFLILGEAFVSTRVHYVMSFSTQACNPGEAHPKPLTKSVGLSNRVLYVNLSPAIYIYRNDDVSRL